MKIKKIVWMGAVFFVTATMFLACTNFANSFNMGNKRTAADDETTYEEEFDISSDDELAGEGADEIIVEENGIEMKLVKPNPFDDIKDANHNGFTLNLDNLGIYATFDDNNVPSYKLVKGVSWTSFDTSKNGYTAGQPSGYTTKGKGYTMSGITYKQYRGKNPNFNGDSAYNNLEQMKRFYFYKFEGSAAGQSTKNDLIAIDTYSKLVFAFSVPKKWSSVAGIAKPETWGSVESGEAAKPGNSKYSFAVKGLKYFYEYDPVGIVEKESGGVYNIKMYNWSGDRIRSNSDYSPRFNGTLYDESRKIADYNSDGRSPYAPKKPYYTDASGNKLDVDVEVKEELETYHRMKVTLEKAQIWNHNAKSANRYAANGWMIGVGSWSIGDVQRTNMFDKFYNYAHIVAQMKMALYSDSDAGEGMVAVAGKTQTTSTIQAGLGYLFGSQGVRDDAAYKVGIKSGKDQPVVQKEHIITYKDGDKVGLDFSFDLVKYDEPMGNYTQMEWPYWYCKDGEITVTLEYDDASGKFKYKSYSDAYMQLKNCDRVYAGWDGKANSGRHTPSNTTDADAKKYRDNIRNFELPVGQAKSFKIVVNGRDGSENFNCGGGATGLNDDIEVVYQLKFEKLPDIKK